MYKGHMKVIGKNEKELRNASKCFWQISLFLIMRFYRNCENRPYSKIDTYVVI